jgi:hypothetical protein
VSTGHHVRDRFWQAVQGPNLSPESREAIQNELQRRKDDCTNYAAEVAQRRRDFLDRETYGKQSP